MAGGVEVGRVEEGVVIAAAEKLQTQIDLHEYPDGIFKGPLALASLGRARDASKLLEAIFEHYGYAPAGHPEGPYGGVYHHYIAGWLALGCLAIGEKIPAELVTYLDTFAHASGGFFAKGTWSDTPDAISTAHMGMVALRSGNKDSAVSAADWLTEFLKVQDSLDDGKFYLRLHIAEGAAGGAVRVGSGSSGGLSLGRSVTEDATQPEASLGEEGGSFDPSQDEMEVAEVPAVALVRESNWTDVISATADDAAYFMLGYPLGFLVLMAQETNDERYINAAKGYADFLLTCKGVTTSANSHKVAWGCALLYEATGEAKYREGCQAILAHFETMRTDASRADDKVLWHPEDSSAHPDQNWELVHWHVQISHILERAAARYNTPSEARGFSAASAAASAAAGKPHEAGW